MAKVTWGEGMFPGVRDLCLPETDVEVSHTNILSKLLNTLLNMYTKRPQGRYRLSPGSIPNVPKVVTVYPQLTNGEGWFNLGSCNDSNLYGSLKAVP